MTLPVETTEFLVARFVKVGQDAFTDGERPRLPAVRSIASARAVSDLLRTPSPLASRLARRRVDAVFADAGMTLAARLAVVIDKLGAVPVDLASDDRAQVEEMALRLLRVKESLVDAARARRMQAAAERFARGMELDRHSPLDVGEATAHLLQGIADHQDLLAEAEIDEETLGRLREQRSRLDEMVARAASRRGERSSLQRSVHELALGLEAFFHLFRARVRSALGGDNETMTRVLALLPRAPERRGGAAQ